MEDDLRQTLDELAGRNQQSIVSQLLEVQKHQFDGPRSFAWARNFTCLSIDQNSVRRRVNGSRANKISLSRAKIPISSGDYVVVSYRWDDPDVADQDAGGYFIESGFGWDAKPGQSSNAILDRVLRYLDHVEASAFWIDKDCINQQDPVAKGDAVQVMDLVYRCSNRPIAILTVPVVQQDDLDLLRKVLAGDIVTVTDKNGPVLENWVRIRPRLARRILHLLSGLVSDPWWTRRWTFQEEYCSYTKMELLIPHDEHLSKKSWDEKSRTIEGEIIVKASEFREQVTLFCLASRKLRAFRNERYQKKICKILKRAKSYQVLHRHDPKLWSTSSAETLSTRILADIAHRGSKYPEDLLAIMANCCSYTVRLDGQSLIASQRSSISIALLALFLLNGELIWNSSKSESNTNIWRFLGQQAFSSFKFPEDSLELTFMKRCRLVDVRFSREGIATTGHLWKAYREIPTRDFHLKLHPKTSRHRRLHACLQWLSLKLKRMSFNRLASRLDDFADNRMSAGFQDSGLNSIFKQMASATVKAIETGQNLVVAHLVGKPYRWGVFVAKWTSRTQPMFIFTASEPAARFSELVEKHPSPPKHVSLRVQVPRSMSQDLPRLSVKGWVNGITFPECARPKQVVFKWPSIFEQNGTLDT